MKKLTTISFLVAMLLVIFIGNAVAGRWTFDNKDVEGTWARHTLSAKDGVVGWDYGTVICDDKGNVVGGQATNWQGYSSTVTGGTYNITKDGRLTGTVEVTTEDGDKITIDIRGTINLSKDMITLVCTGSPDNGLDITILVKQPEKLESEKTDRPRQDH